MSQTATRLPLPTAAGLALLVAGSQSSLVGEEASFLVGNVVLTRTLDSVVQERPEEELATEMAGWQMISDQALLNCEAWE